MCPHYAALDYIVTIKKKVQQREHASVEDRDLSEINFTIGTNPTLPQFLKEKCTD